MTAAPFPFGLWKQPPAAAAGGGGTDAGTPTAFWTMNESTGSTRNDSIGSLHLTDDTADTPAVSGKLSNAAALDASTRSLSRAHSTDFDIGANGFTITCWFRVPSTNAAQISFLVNRIEDGDNLVADFSVTTDSDFVYVKVFWDNCGALDEVLAAKFGVTVNTWHFVVATWDRNASLLKISLDGGTFATTACSVMPIASVSPFYVGVVESGSMGGPNYGTRAFDIDAVGWWKNTAFTQDNVTYEYNGGAGRER